MKDAECVKKVALCTLGCKVNQYETEAMAESFEREGYLVVDFGEKADVYVINTCTVTGISARKSRQFIRKARNSNPSAIIAVVGCYAQVAPDEVRDIPGVDLVVGTGQRHRIVDYVKRIEVEGGRIVAVGDPMREREYEELTVGTLKGHVRAILKIQDGCSQFCAYCIIPYARGPARSRQPGNVISEVRELAGRGFKEIVLTGIHLASYGKDLGNTSLVDIIQRVHEVEGIERIRLGSLEPTTITEEFMAAARELDKLCPHYHISLQSGCDETLRRMKRKYTTLEYRRAVEILRENIEDVAVTTDIMVGFPGETDEEFEQTVKFIEDVSPAKMHVFKYSPRKGTLAATFENQIDPDVKEARSKRLISLSSIKTLEFHMKHRGKTMPVLFEQEVKTAAGYIEGLTPNYIRVVCKGDNKMVGRIFDIRLDTAEADYMTGSILAGIDAASSMPWHQCPE